MNQLKSKSEPNTVSDSSGTAGLLFALGTAFCFGVSTPLSKLLLHEVQPWMLAGLMYLGGGLGLLPIYMVRNGLKLTTSPLQRQDTQPLFSSILAGGIVAPVLLMTGLEHSSAAIASLLLNFEGVFTALVAWTIFREQWHWRVVIGIFIITTGGILVSQGTSTHLAWSWGGIAILGTCLAWAIDSNFTVQVSHRDPVQVALCKSGGAGLINVIIASLLGQSFPTFPVFIKVCSAGFVGYGLTYCCFVMALRRLGVSRTGAFFALSPLVGVAIAILFLGESLTGIIALSAILMALGAMLCSGETT